MKYGIKGFFFSVIFTLSACTETVDVSTRYEFEGRTALDYIMLHEKYSTYEQLLHQVKVSSVSKTTVAQLLDARGHFTIFAPTNEAIQAHLDTLYAQHEIDAPAWEGFRDSLKLDSVRRMIVLNSIIDSGDDYPAFETIDLPVTQDAEIPLPNMNDRKLTVYYGEENGDIFINGCLLDATQRDIPLSNGYLHAVKQVIAPNDITMGNFFSQILIDRSEGYHVMAMLVKAVGLTDTLKKYRDEVYEKRYQQGLIPDEWYTYEGYAPQHRYMGFTCFAETDAFWSETLGKPALDITVQDVVDYLTDRNIYPDARKDQNYCDEGNFLHRFVTYHFLPEKLSKDHLVYHYNEEGYNENMNARGVAMCDYYTTMGQRRLLKLYECAENEGTFLNRFPNLDNGRSGNYHELSCDPGKEGIFVGKPDLEGKNSLINGYVYPIDQLLVFDDETARNMGKSRLRFDATSLWPEFMNNDIRCSKITDERHLRVCIPKDVIYPYLADLRLSDDTYFIYWTARGWGWMNYLGDEVNIQGNMDVTMRLPPVPYTDTYELRYSCQNGGVMGNRGIFQFYWGEDPDNLAAMDIPLDLMIGSEQRSTKAGYFPSGIGWEQDTDDDDYNINVDKIMRNKGFMKGANIYRAGSVVARKSSITMRRIIIKKKMEANKMYYLRFKACLDDPKREFYLDYLELCPKSVYDNPYEPEDIW